MSTPTAPTTMDVAALSPADLADLMAAFNTATDRLQQTHHALQAEVRRLKGELHEANEKLRRSRELAALGEMAAGIAHEIRNPLGSIRLYAAMLAEDLTDRAPQRALARKIAQAVLDMDAIVADVLAFAREVRIRPGETTPGELFDHALQACEALLHGGTIEVVRADARRTEAQRTIEADGGLLNQALTNLIRNAIEAMEGRGRLTLDVTEGRLPESEREAIVMTVRDTGPGVDPAVAARLFNPFVTTRATGTGLGLAIAHRIVDAHGGTISIDNHPSGGAVVTIALPAMDAVTTRRPVEAPAVVVQGRTTRKRKATR